MVSSYCSFEDRTQCREVAVLEISHCRKGTIVKKFRMVETGILAEIFRMVKKGVKT